MTRIGYCIYKNDRAQGMVRRAFRSCAARNLAFEPTPTVEAGGVGPGCDDVTTPSSADAAHRPCSITALRRKVLAAPQRPASSASIIVRACAWYPPPKRFAWLST